MLEFGISEKQKKFEKIFHLVLPNQLIYLVNIKTMMKIYSNYMCFSKSPNFTMKNLIAHKNLKLSLQNVNEGSGDFNQV